MSESLLTPLDIADREFKRVLRGYDPGEVDTFLDQIVDASGKSSPITTGSRSLCRRPSCLHRVPLRTGRGQLRARRMRSWPKRGSRPKGSIASAIVRSGPSDRKSRNSVACANPFSPISGPCFPATAP